MALPKDPFMLYSYVNTMLRDSYSSLQAFCEDNGVTAEDLEEKLAAAGFEYDEEQNQFR